MSNLEAEFNSLMLETYEKAKDSRYFATYFKQMLDEYGGVQTAKRLLRGHKIQFGLRHLSKLGRLDISVEAAVIQDRFHSLFTEDEIAEARRRLDELGYFKNRKVKIGPAIVPNKQRPNKPLLEMDPERVAYWFFRLNGCLTIQNFVVHRDLSTPEEPRSMFSDADILAMRFPYRRELYTSGNPMQDHPCFDSDGRIDVLIAEVKHGPCKLNGPWTHPSEKGMQRVLYALGAFPIDRVEEVAIALYERGCYSDGVYRMRQFAIGNKKNGQLQPDVVQLTWPEILAFIHGRFNQYKRQKSDHQPWDQIGDALYHYAQNESEQEYVSSTLAAMERFVTKGTGSE